MNIYTQRRPMASLAFGLALVCGLTLFGACSPDKPKFNAIDVTGANYAKGFSLKDHTGQERKLTDFKGKVVVVFFWLHPVSRCMSHHHD